MLDSLGHLIILSGRLGSKLVRQRVARFQLERLQASLICLPGLPGLQQRLTEVDENGSRSRVKTQGPGEGPDSVLVILLQLGMILQ